MLLLVELAERRGNRKGREVARLKDERLVKQEAMQERGKWVNGLKGGTRQRSVTCSRRERRRKQVGRWRRGRGEGFSKLRRREAEGCEGGGRARAEM